MIDWHRLFGLTLTDFFTGTSYTVELEKDLSLRQQFLDVVVIKSSRKREDFIRHPNYRTVLILFQDSAQLKYAG